MSLQLLISSLYLPATAAALLKDYVEDRQSTRGAATTVTASSFVDKSRNMLDSGSGSDSDPDSDPDSDDEPMILERPTRHIQDSMGAIRSFQKPLQF